MTDQAKETVREMRRKGSPDPLTKALAIASKLLVILASVGIFVYVIETARWFVRLLAGMPSFVALLFIIVFGVGELIWVIIVSEDSIPRDRTAVLRRTLRYLGWEGAAAAFLIVVPKGALAVFAQVRIAMVVGPWEVVAASVGVLTAAAAYFVLRRPAPVHREVDGA